MRAALQAALRSRSTLTPQVLGSRAVLRSTSCLTARVIEWSPARQFSDSTPKQQSTPPHSEPAQNHFNATVTVADVLKGRGEKVYSTTANTMVFDAVKVCAQA